MAVNFFQARDDACCLRNFFAPSPQPPEEMQAETLRSTPAAYTATAAPKLCPTTPIRLGSISARVARKDSAPLVKMKHARKLQPVGCKADPFFHSSDPPCEPANYRCGGPRQGRISGKKEP